MRTFRLMAMKNVQIRYKIVKMVREVVMCIFYLFFIILWIVGLGGLGVTCLPRDPRFAGSNPAEFD